MLREPQVGDVISYLPKGSICTWCVVKIANEVHLSNVSRDLLLCDWEYGIHKSLTPEGWKLMQTWSTSAMDRAGEAAAEANGVDLPNAEPVWDAMVAAAPEYNGG